MNKKPVIIALLNLGCLAMHQPDALHKTLKAGDAAQCHEELTHLGLTGQSQNMKDNDGNTPIIIGIRELIGSMHAAEQSAKAIKQHAHHYAHFYLTAGYIALFGRRIVRALRATPITQKPWVAFKAACPIAVLFLAKRYIKGCLGWIAEKIFNIRKRRAVSNRQALCTMLLNATNNPIDATSTNNLGKSSLSLLDEAIAGYHTYGIGKHTHAMREHHRTMLTALQEAVGKRGTPLPQPTREHKDDNQKQPLTTTATQHEPEVTPAAPMQQAPHHLYPDLFFDQPALYVPSTGNHDQSRQATSSEQLYPTI